jgi:hypothetical protein
MRSLLLAASLSAALLGPAAAGAQPFRSDNTGPIITGSGVAGGGYTGAGFRDLENALFRGVEGRIAFRTREVADAVLGAARELGRAVCEGSLQPPREWPASLPLDTAAQRVVCGVAEERRDSTTAWLLHTLTGGIPGPHVAAAEELVASLAGIFRGAAVPLDPRARWIDGARWARVLEAYEAYLNAAPPALLDPPPGELAVIGAVLQEVVRAGLAASR